MRNAILFGNEVMSLLEERAAFEEILRVHVCVVLLGGPALKQTLRPGAGRHGSFRLSVLNRGCRIYAKKT